MQTKILQKGLRGRLPKGSQSWLNVNPQLKRALNILYPEVELIHLNGTYDVYRVLGRGATKNEDTLIHEFRLHHSPGDWLIHHMMQHDAHRQVPNTKDGLLINHLKQHDQADYNKDQNLKHKLNDAILDLKDNVKFILSGRESIHLRG